MSKYKINPIKQRDILEIYVDGASRGNIGPSSSAFIFVKDSDIIYQKSDYIGEATNNIAEYQAIINALEEAEKFSRWHIKIYSDSELVIRQINKIYRIKAKHLSKLCAEVYVLCSKSVYKSTDAGNSWVDLKVKPHDKVRFYKNMAINPKNNETIVISGTNGIYASYHGGRKWQRIKNLGHPEKTSIAIDYATDGTLYAFYIEKKDWGTIKKSVNDGKDWIPVVINKRMTVRDYIYTLK